MHMAKLEMRCFTISITTVQALDLERDLIDVSQYTIPKETSLAIVGILLLHSLLALRGVCLILSILQRCVHMHMHDLSLPLL